MNRKARRIRHMLLQGLYGVAIGSLIPIFVTLSFLASLVLPPTWNNWWTVHLNNGAFLLVDVVPLMFGVMMAKLAGVQQELLTRKQDYKLAKLQLEEQYSQWKMISENTPVGYAVLDRELNLLFANRVCGELVGHAPEDILGKKCYAYFGDGTICPGCPVVKAYITRTIQTNFKREFNTSGEEHILEQTAVPIIKNGQVQQVIKIVVDVSERMRFMQTRHEELLATIDTLVGIIELKDGYTGGHSQRVRRWAVKLARGLGLSEQEIVDIDMASCLHDIGKIGIAGIILNKPDDLTSYEYEIIKQHPVVGADILSGIPRLEEASRIIRYHHEAFGGGGYPDGLSGREIPLGSRIICLADAFDAMTSDRAYRGALSPKEALQEIKAGSGTQFDPQIVEILLDIVGEGKVVQFQAKHEKIL